MKITRIEIRDYRGVRELAVDAGEKGLLFKGKNTGGKTSILNAISAALAARGIDPSDIRHGADSAEILISMDGLRVRRRISEGGPSLAVTNRDGDRWSKPQSRLDELLGTAGIDALAFFLAKPAERRKMVLEAMALTVTPEQVLAWVNDPALVDQLGTSGPALEVVERYRKHFYERRTDANRVHKEKRRAWDEASAAAPAVRPDDDPDAVAELDAAGAAVKAIAGRDEAITSIRKANEATRTRIEELRAAAREEDKQPGPPEETDLETLARVIAHSEGVVTEARAALAQAQRLLDGAVAGLETARRRHQAMVDYHARIAARREISASFNRQADDLQRSIDSAEGGATVSQEDRLAAEGRLTAARGRAERALAAASARLAHSVAASAATAARAAEEEAERLDAIVKRLTEEAPRQLAASGGIEGVALQGDRLTLDGTDLDSLSGAEQMRFAVRLAKRANAKSRILIVDGLERLDAVRGVEFVKEATDGGWQLFATRVADGELVVEAIEA